MTTFYFVRHAHTNWTPNDNEPLSESGLANAQWVAEALHSYPIEAIYASPYRRAGQTVEPLAQQLNLPIHLVDDLRERKLAGKPVDNFREAVEALWQDPTFSHPGGESNLVAQKRGAAAAEVLMKQHPTGHIVVASHGNIMTLILQHFDPSLGYDFWKGLTMPDVYRFDPVDLAATTRLWESSVISF